MLNKNDKRRVRRGIYRSDVRKRFVAPPPQTLPKKTLAFFNTPLGIWILSTIAVSLLGWSYAWWQASRVNQEHIDRLDDEIEARLHAVVDFDFHKSDKPLHIANILLFPPGPERMVYPEFANRNLKSLLFELQNLVPSGEWSEVSNARIDVELMEHEYLDRELTGEEHKTFVERTKTTIARRWTGEKWLQRHFSPYEIPVFLALFILLLLLYLYAIYRLIKWLYRSAKSIWPDIKHEWNQRKRKRQPRLSG